MKRVMCGALLLDFLTRTTISREKRAGNGILRTWRRREYRARERCGTKLEPRPSATRLMIKSKLSISCDDRLIQRCVRIHLRNWEPVLDVSLMRSQL